MNRHKEEQFLKSTNIEIDSLDILQELFGINDKLIKVIENRLGVSITPVSYTHLTLPTIA